MPSKSLLKYGFKAKAERLSEQYRAELSISKFDPLDAFALADHLEIPIYAVDEFEGQVAEKHLERLKDTSRFFAMWMPNSDGVKIIVHNNHHSIKRQQSNLMHEIAHIILKHEISEEAAQLCFLYGLHYFNTEQEQEAKFLGACLQITRPGLLWALKRSFTPQEISEHFNASVEMVQFRINSTGVLKQRFRMRNSD